MTEKQETILTSALHLFAEQGYHGTSTSKVAQAAGVSEGLIFRHFQSKEGLLSALLELAETKVAELVANMFQNCTPEETILKMLALPFEIEEVDHPFWKLLYSIKWQTCIHSEEIGTPFRNLLVSAFTQLNASDPITEAELVLLINDGSATVLLLHPTQNKEALKSSLLDLYTHKLKSLES